MDKKPPLGVMPKYVHDQHSLSDLFQSVLRYMTEGCAIPQEWKAEIDDLISTYMEEGKRG